MFVGGRLAGAIVCVPCGNGGAVLVPAKLPPVVEHKTRKPEGYESALRMLRTYVRAARLAAEVDAGDNARHFEGRAEGLEVAIETVKRFAGGES
jgi:hypothetical protein